MNRGIILNKNAGLNIKGVNVDFIANYKYPYFLNKYRGYIIKEVDCIDTVEVEESKLLTRSGYLPIYIVKCNSLNLVSNKLENEKMPFNLIAVNLEIENKKLEIDEFKGSLIFNISDEDTLGDLVFCNNYGYSNGVVTVKGILGSLDSCVKSSLILYSRRVC